MLLKQRPVKKILSPEGIKRAKGEELKTTDCTLPLAEPRPEEFIDSEGKEILTWIKYCHYKYQELKKLLRGKQETIFNAILDLQVDIGKEEKEEKMYDYLGTLWGGVSLDNNGTKKGVTLDIQERIGLGEDQY